MYGDQCIGDLNCLLLTAAGAIRRLFCLRNFGTDETLNEFFSGHKADRHLACGVEVHRFRRCKKSRPGHPSPVTARPVLAN